ncbi:unnamed protein product [Ilex paraguariensis]|uniref:Pectinesterase n=1 Tax=Ilex paraguariensis TaxID=185542 RepID=A0ABC8SCD8_9AQUA
MIGKIVVTLVSLILVVGVVIGIVAVQHHEDSKNGENTSTSMKSVTTICASTDFKDACARSLGPVAKNSSATTKDYILAAIQATINEVKKSEEVTSKQSVDAEKDPYNHMAVEDCKELLKYAVDELQASFSMVGDSELHTLNDRVSELMNWLSAVYSYQTSCLDGVENPEYKSAIKDGMVNATQLTSNALSIVSQTSEILKAFNIPNINIKPNSRRLLEVNEIGHDGYPTWFSTADRKLLAARPASRARPNAVVAKDGSGQYRTISAALAAYPKNLRGRYVIYVKAGIYDESVTVTYDQKNVFMYGDGPLRTIVTGHKNFGVMKITTMNTATFAAVGQGFIAKSMGFRNTAGPVGQQAVALRVQSDMAAIFDCRIEGYQDTLYYQAHRQFYRNCVISGTIDFIFGKGSAVIQNSEIIVRRPGADQRWNTITADGRETDRQVTGLVLQNCRIVPERALFPVRFQIANYLGRPWKQFSTTVVMQSELGDLIHPQGWFPWQGEHFESSCNFYEFANRGPGARTIRRSRSFTKFRVLGPREAWRYTAAAFIQGGLWLKYTTVPFLLGL